MTMPRAQGFRLKAKDRIAKLERERDAYRKAKQENDERFMLERDAAQARVRELERERDEARAQLAQLLESVQALWPSISEGHFRLGYGHTRKERVDALGAVLVALRPAKDGGEG